MGYFELTFFSGSSLRFLRKSVIGFPQRAQKENCDDQPSPAMICRSPFLISFLQISHLVTYIEIADPLAIGFQDLDSDFVIVKLIFVAPELPGSRSVFMAKG